VVHILSQMNPVHTYLPTQFFQHHSNIILQSTPRSLKLFLPLISSNQNYELFTLIILLGEEHKLFTKLEWISENCDVGGGGVFWTGFFWLGGFFEHGGGPLGSVEGW
jgi:hypothetical protein